MRGEQHTDGPDTSQMSDLGDDALLALVREGDERAFEALVLRYRRPLRSYCMRLGVPADGTEDVIQQTLLEAWLALRGGAQVHAFKAWLFRVAHNVALDTLRKTPRVVDLAAGEASAAAGAWPDTHEPELREALTAVAALPLLQREAIVRTALAGESHEQVGRNLGLTAGAVRGLIYRGRATLRSALAALIPPWLPRLIANRSSTSVGMRESLLAFAANASSTGSAGALVKAGVIVVAAAAAIGTTLPAHAARSGIAHRGAGQAPASVSNFASAAGEASDLTRSGGDPQARSAVARSSRAPAPGRRESISGGSADLRGASSEPTTGGSGTGSAASGQTRQQSDQPPAGASAETPSATAAGSEPAEAASSKPSEAPSPPAGGSSGGAQTPSGSESSGSGSGEKGGLVGELVHTVEKTLETTVEGTLGGLLHH